MTKDREMHSLILKKIQTDKWPHFCVIEGQNQTLEKDHQQGLNWCHQFLEHYARFFDKKVNDQHPDVLTIGQELLAEGSFYKVEDFREFFYFQQRTKFNLDHQLVFIFQAQKINETLSNKILKALEEPKDGQFIFLFNYLNKPLLPTLHSRAIFLALEKQNHSPIEKSLDFQHKAMSAHYFLEQYRAKEDEWWNYAFKQVTKKSHSFSLHQLLTKNYQLYQNSRLYHGPVQERAAFLYQVLEQI